MSLNAERLYHGNRSGLKVGDRIEPSEQEMPWDFDYVFSEDSLCLTPDPWDASRHALYFRAPGGVYEVEPVDVEPEADYLHTLELLGAKHLLPPRWLAKSAVVTRVVGPGPTGFERKALLDVYEEAAARIPRTRRHRRTPIWARRAAWYWAGVQILRERRGTPSLPVHVNFVDIYANAMEVEAMRADWMVRTRFANDDGTVRPTTFVKDERDKVGRNVPCWCGSGKKHKKCHQGDSSGRGIAA